MTQLPQIKVLAYIVSNLLSLLTVLPLAVSFIAFSMVLWKQMNNRLFFIIGTMSYELYLVHAFTLGTIKNNWSSIILFIGITFVATLVVYNMNSKSFQIGGKNG